MQALGVLHVAGERIQPVEAAGSRVVPARSEVLLLESRVEVFAAVAQRGQWRGLRRDVAVFDTVYGEALAVGGFGDRW